ncbi:MAG: ABC transporter permease, partial [Alphaproteobacteria bacterium]|nr:ABC transporter permease [Alphaproteobacteria bacterium]
MGTTAKPSALSNIWFIAINDVRHALSDRAVLLWLVLMPPVFFYFIGNVTQATFSQNGQNLIAGMAPPAVSDFAGQRLVTLLEEAGFEIVAPGNGGAAPAEREIVLSGDISQGLAQGETVTLTYEAEGPTARFEAAKIEGAVARLNMELTLAVTLGQPGTVADRLTGFANAERLIGVDIRAGGRLVKLPTGIQLTVPGIMVMFTMLVLLGSGAVMLFLERERGVLLRLAASPISRTEIVVGKWGGKMALGLIQIAMAMA